MTLISPAHATDKEMDVFSNGVDTILRSFVSIELSMRQIRVIKREITAYQVGLERRGIIYPAPNIILYSYEDTDVLEAVIISEYDRYRPTRIEDKCRHRHEISNHYLTNFGMTYRDRRFSVSDGIVTRLW